MTTPDSSYRTIPLSRGHVAIVDADDHEWLSRWKWYAHWNRRKKWFYARRTDNAAGRSFDMHREILGLRLGDKGLGDHINGDTLDNRRSNLRVVDHFQNAQNRKPRCDSKKIIASAPR